MQWKTVQATLHTVGALGFLELAPLLNSTIVPGLDNVIGGCRFNVINVNEGDYAYFGIRADLLTSPGGLGYTTYEIRDDQLPYYSVEYMYDQGNYSVIGIVIAPEGTVLLINPEYYLCRR